MFNKPVMLNDRNGSIAAGESQGFWLAAIRSKPAAQITRIASLPQAGVGHKRKFAGARKTRHEAGSDIVN